MKNTKILSQVIEIREVENIEEVAKLLSSGNWIALLATSAEPHVFCLGKISEE